MDGNFFLKELVKEDSKIIAQIYNKNFPSIKKFILLNSGNTEDAEDIFQKSLIQIIIRYKREKFSISGDFDAYLMAICKNLWRRELNLHKKRVTNVEKVEVHDEYIDSSFALLEQKRQELFIEKFAEITGNCKEILTLFFAKTPYEEIVANTEYSSELVVRQRVFKCKKRLAELIKKDSRYNSLKEL
ncbi:RNA polymerase sigma factor, sigma-70 family [Aquimarina amphilecti]|uniref:RNA polymerase sigma factor, sigma-70 family n=1 Tax=Aquimarina amphilecti TaxID=1038014 RepID=A0A1H7V8W0_AQUAM|nr:MULTISPECIES: sigma-70 family RNA polymerase sigma factor [Aquimarina]MBQ4805779.1 sigma-70 family RNA polymerase sigma factor [Aquimarina sp. MMG015]SEM05378.1 RNA polymerase sigma factor, sigma-70 family [Aquimarina amphilecti]